ncbi:serine hydrolase [Paraglaciecola aquimarina]|uniref:Serine hydrolase n=1 Tax=Paraglaciecola algarum TaxID=3050085 RepID=A0ABS9D558_9ALTE|nr:serine hydrolase [Paraglaciecola sp. G1-23]MCF2947809.1 serine hydrolase [Paraglaciecola sp. G1-23]
MKILSLIFACACLPISQTSFAQKPYFSEHKVDQLVQQTLATFKVPGAAIGVIKDGKILLNKGYGLQAINQPDLVDQDTLFKIASTTKAFNSAALAILIDQGKLSWDSKVVDFLPNFALYDDWVTKEFTVADLLTHRSGLARFAGDLMLWPEPAGFSREEIINNLKFLKPASGFRSEYAYDNLLYIVAGEVVAKITGMSWEEFVEQNIMAPLGMQRCFAGPVPQQQMTNIAQPHSVINNKIEIVKRNQTYHKSSVMAAAGGIKCSVSDLLTWVDTQLNKGISAKGVRLFSEEQSATMWSPHTILSVYDDEKKYHNTNFKSYGLGWGLADMHGYKRVSHTGTLSGNLAYITLIPELDLGVIVLINQSSYYARSTLMHSIVQMFMDVQQQDWLAIQLSKQQERQAQRIAENAAKSISNTKPQRAKVLLPLTAYAGIYQDPWFGRVKVSLKNGQLRFQSLKSKKLLGDMLEHQGHEFVVWYDDRSLEGDAIARFNTDEKGNVIGLMMERLHDDIDASFDYDDLNFSRINQ